MKRPRLHIVLPVLLLLLLACGGENTGPGSEPPGAAETTETRVLETGAALLQDVTPVQQIAVYLVGFHPSRDDPSIQMESHHYCHQVNEEFAQCVLYDGNTEEANLHGIEYIISSAIYEGLPEDEKPYWHPHNYEILSGQLRGPGLPDVAERELMEGKMNSYGKTWHVWMTGVHEREGDPLPLGEPHLAWSFNRDGEARPGLVEARDQRMGLSTAEAREGRADLAGLADPQDGVNTLRSSFPNATDAPPGVEARDSAGTGASAPDSVGTGAGG